MSHPLLPEENIENKTLRKKTWIGLIVLIAALGAGWWLFNYIANQPKQDGTPKTLRKVLSFNEKVFSTDFDTNHLAKEYPLSAAAKKVRVNGSDGLRDSVNEQSWRLKVVKAPGDTLIVTLDEIKKLPKKDIVFDFKCIEGWSQVSHWAGVPMKTFMEHYHLTTQSQMKYIGLQTPDKGYYVGIDMPSALHPQTLLCYEMNGKPLPINQGYPLRLIIPVKYGIKHLKRIGTLFFSNQKPPDFWAEQGYDYYAGH